MFMDVGIDLLHKEGLRVKTSIEASGSCRSVLMTATPADWVRRRRTSSSDRCGFDRRQKNFNVGAVYSLGKTTYSPSVR